ncbi:hypothetical protein BJF85_13095 [Saccharomonospora sp. CUA-673]|uniref:neutral zinc metallopeptidase n=1 Tax=Saccharomonospora sp. CUA-673 TaxID=1904969 RepID=UPI0009699BA4|nr:neutral zinc metallopeptidase [Saccharomonospora sp. CUA-673]OLT48181.1 hypothetical protein BJF85_13095 [Saccharomonospora sp. CUA-673]
MAAALGGFGVVVLVAILTATLVGGDPRNTADREGGAPVPPATDTSITSSPSTTTSTSETTTSSETSETVEPSIITFTEGPGGGEAPTSGGEKIYRLADHPLLQNPDSGLRAVQCSLPGWQSNPQAAEAFLTAATDCLNDAWGTLLRSHDLPFEEPNLHFPAGTSYETTTCGTHEVSMAKAALYCANNLYMPYQGLQADRYGDRPGVYLALLAHEYGHHVQYVAGIFEAAWHRMNEAGGQGSPGADAVSRRLELQAQCFSGMFMGSHVGRSGPNGVNQTMLDQAWYDQETRGDGTSGTTDHGSNANYSAWWQQGSRDNRLQQCNTWNADEGSVS